MGFLDMLRPKFGKSGRQESATAQAAPPPTASQPRVTVPAAGPIAAAPSKTYTVKSGDTLSKIAKAELGDAQKYMLIFEANRNLVKDPDKIFPGQVLKIPQSSELH